MRDGTPQVVFRFVLKGGDRWNWPVEGKDSIAAFRELLDRAKVVYTEYGMATEAEQIPPSGSGHSDSRYAGPAGLPPRSDGGTQTPPWCLS